MAASYQSCVGCCCFSSQGNLNAASLRVACAIRQNYTMLYKA